MRTCWLKTGLAVAGLILAAPSFGQAVPHPPVEAYGTLPEASQPAIAPDGKHLALVSNHNGRYAAMILTLDQTGVAPMMLPFEYGVVSGVQWANNDRLLVTIMLNVEKVIGEGADPMLRTMSVDVNTKQVAELFNDRKSQRNFNSNASRIVDLAMNDPKHIFMPLYENNNDTFWSSVFSVDITTGSSKRVIEGNKYTAQWIMDGTGKVVARLDVTKFPNTRRLFVYDTKGDDHEIAASTDRNKLNIAGLNPQGDGLVLVEIDPNTSITGLVTRNLKDGTVTPLFYDPKYDINGPLTDPWTGRVIGVQVIYDMPVDHYFDPELEAFQKQLEQTFPGNTVHISDWDMARKKFVLRVAGTNTPASYFLLDLVTHSAKRLTRTYEGVPDAALGPVKLYPYKARDGLDIPAYLTLPPGKEAKNLPAVILPHGGPQARDSLGFDWMAQFLANRGYAVLQPNYRGSDGYGKKFVDLGHGEWGLKMQDDVTDGVKKLITDGIVDPKRICIAGWSYGGYATLAGATLTPELYACAAAGAGVSDLRTILRTESRETGSDSEVVAYWKEFIGDRFSDTGKLDASSPAKHADKVRGPILLMHGEYDWTVRPDQSRLMESALKSAGKKVKLVILPHETHYLQSTSSRVAWLTEMEALFKENIGN